jgi:hypothetical protein
MLKGWRSSGSGGSSTTSDCFTYPRRNDEPFNAILFSKRIVVGVGTLKLIHSVVASVLEHWVNCGESFCLLTEFVEERSEKRIFVAPLQRQQGGWIADRRGTQNKPADHGEDGAVGADIPADLK